MKIFAKQVVLSVSLVALGGCQLFAPSHLASGKSERALAAKQGSARGISALDQGREHLRAQRNGQAISAFNAALMTGEDPAAAYNGLGVAYSRLGREDLAYRFFKKAAMSDPNNPVYSRNLAMLMDSPGFNLAAMNRGERQLAPQSATAPPLVSRQAAAPPRPGLLHREGKGQVSLITITPAEPAGLAVGARCPAAIAKGASSACKTAPMPVMASRNLAPKAVPAIAAPDSGPAVKSPAALAEPAKTAKPQRKTIDLTAPPSAPVPAAMPLAPSNKATAAS